MSLRVRLIVAFFVLSVLPLAAVTFYTYSTNLQAVREAAGNEAELLAGELSQRMQVVTAQLSQRFEQLMSATSTAAAPPAPSLPSSTKGAAAPAPRTTAAAQNAATASNSAAVAAGDVANVLGELAMVINNVEIRGVRGGRGRGTGPGGGGGRRGGGPPPPGTPGGVPLPPGTPSIVPGSGPASATTAAGVSPTPPSATAGRGADPLRGLPTDGGDRGRFRGDRGGPPPDGGRGGRGPGFQPGETSQGDGSGPPPPVADDDPTRISIDVAPLRREILQQIVPDGDFEKLTPEERQRVFAELNQRMLGIQQGIQMLRERVAERVADARQAQTAAASSTAAAGGASGTPARPVAPAPPAAAPAAPVAPTAPAAPAAAPESPRRRTEISNGRLAVSVEQNGEVVSQASAEINLPNLLATVFTTTKRERGEVPFAVAKDGRLETQTADDRRTIEALGMDDLRADTPATTRVRPGWVIATTADPTGLQAKFGIARPLGEAVADLRRTLALNAGFGLGLIVLALVGIVPLSSRLTRNLENLSRGVARISQGDYGARVAVRSKDEIGQLASAFNKMAADVEQHQRLMVEQERLRRELELGRQIQHDMLPQAPLRMGLTEVKGVSVPAREVGGDFFNYFQLDNGTLALIVGDVSGKGVGAALLMANIQASLRTRLSLGQDLASLARELDRDIESSTPGPVYATLFVGIFDPGTRLLRCVNAGHNPQYVLRRGGSLERMEATGLPIGLLAGHGYVEQRVQLEAGDLLFFFTDGCVEAANTDGDMFGMDRLESALRSAGAISEDMLGSVETAISHFRAGVELSDDATMMVVRVG
jgi:serine phosphatase RsbU (regulator of sigma subunit)